MKKRHHPEKPQNNYGGDYKCKCYDTLHNGWEFCHDEGQSGWGSFIDWAFTGKDGKLLCKGNRHNCGKLRLKWLASQGKK